MKIKSTRFGEIEVMEADIISMRGTILGFEHLRRFVLLTEDDQTPLWWLQAVEDPAIAFVVVNPRLVMPDYNPTFPKGDLDFLEIRDNEEMALLSIVTVRLQPFRVTANIKAPILINAVSKAASQVVLDADYPVQYDFFDNKAGFTTGPAPGFLGSHRTPMAVAPSI